MKKVTFFWHINILITATVTEKIKRVALFELENPFIINLGGFIHIIKNTIHLFCGENKLVLLKKEWGKFPTHIVQINLALPCKNLESKQCKTKGVQT